MYVYLCRTNKYCQLVFPVFQNSFTNQCPDAQLDHLIGREGGGGVPPFPLDPLRDVSSFTIEPELIEYLNVKDFSALLSSSYRCNGTKHVMIWCRVAQILLSHLFLLVHYTEG